MEVLQFTLEDFKLNVDPVKIYVSRDYYKKTGNPQVVSLTIPYQIDFSEVEPVYPKTLLFWIITRMHGCFVEAL